MTRKPAALSVALALALVLAAAALAGTTRTAADPGVTPTSILLGGTVPLSGQASSLSAVARGAAAYFSYVNANGGINGRKVEYRYVDDSYDPSKTVVLTRELVEQDKVFAIFNAVGTEANQGVRPYLTANKVPQLFIASGSTSWGKDGGQYPYSFGFQPSYQAEGWVYGKFLARTKPGARIAVLFQNDDYGKDILGGLRKGLERSKARVIAAEPYEVTASDVQSQVAALKASGADTFAIFAFPPKSIQAYLAAQKVGWKPATVIINAVGSPSDYMKIAAFNVPALANGSISISFVKDPTDPTWKNDSAMKLYRQIMRRYAPGASLNAPLHVYGMAAAYSMVEALKKAGQDLTREGVVKAVGSMNHRNPFLLPGIVVKTGAGDRFPIEQMLLQRWSKGSWKSFGGLWGYRGG